MGMWKCRKRRRSRLRKDATGANAAGMAPSSPYLPHRNTLERQMNSTVDASTENLVPTRRTGEPIGGCFSQHQAVWVHSEQTHGIRLVRVLDPG